MSAVGNLKKPVMRGLLHAQIKRNVITGILVSIGAGVITHFLINKPRQDTYAEFYKNYDIEREFNEIRNRGIFHSAKAD